MAVVESFDNLRRRPFTPPSGGHTGPRPVGTIGLDRDRLEIAPAMSAETRFPVEHLPPIMRGAVEALEYHVQAPRSLCAHSVISAAMLVCQGLADVEVRGLPSPRPLTLFMLAVAVSGERKSACDDIALKSVSQHEAQMRLHHIEELRQFKAVFAAFDAEKKQIERDAKLTHDERKNRLLALREPVAPLLPIIRAKEANLEGLLNVLQLGPASVGIFTSEGGQFLGGHGMGDDAKTRTITGLSELWDSGSAQRVRAKEHCFLVGRRVGISLAAQPKVASTLLGDELAKDQGFVGRFLVTMPDSTIGTRAIRGTEPDADERLLSFHRQCRRLLGHPLPLQENTRNELAPPTIGLDDEAWKVWQGFAQSVEGGCAPGGMWQPVRSAALKMAENVARIAGILTLFQDPDVLLSRAVSGRSRSRAITGETMAAACAVGMFYLQEALRLTGNAILDPETRAQNELGEWILERFKPGGLTSAGLIQRFAPAHLRTDAKTTRARIDALINFGHLEPVGRMEIDGKPVRETFRVIAGEA